MGITETVRQSSWYRRPTGRRALTDEPPYFAIAQSDDDDAAHRDIHRRRMLARMAGFIA